MELSQFLRSRRGNELVGVVVLAVGVTIALSVVTYHPDDSSAFYTSARDEISNAIGYYGATLAWLLVGFFGLASLLFPAALLIVGWNRFWGREMEFLKTKFLGLLILTISLPPLLDLALGDRWYRNSLLPSGGYVGSEIRDAVAANLNGVGAAIILITIFVVGLLLATRISLADIFLRLREALSALGRQIVLHWARLTERRRKERMKNEVVRKHLDQVEPDELTPAIAAMPDGSGMEAPVVREVRGRGRFQIRKVTKAELRRVASDLVREGGDDFSGYYEEPPAPRPRRAERPTAELEPVERLDIPSVARKGTIIDDAPAFKARNGKAKTAAGNRSLSSERLPFPNLLKPGSGEEKIDEAAHRRYMETCRLIEQRCAEFSVDGEVTAYHPGPVVTTFEFKPSAGVKYSKVVNLSDDLALALEAESIRIERISGSSTVGIEIPNKERELIALRDIIDTEVFRQSDSLLTLALGKDIHGDPVVTDLAKMPHLLVAGATGAGKSVGLNSMIVSLLYKAMPKDLRILMIDPKMVELKVYEDVPHLLHPIVTDPKLASNALLWTVQEMENRYRLLASCGVRNIAQFNEMVEDPDKSARRGRIGAEEFAELGRMHYIVVIIDEFADLMMVATKDVEDSVTRLAQKARAVGIHLIIATQRPSVDVITGVIKANFPSRISYQVASKIDSRTILDTQGSEKLLGNGDMLFLPPGTARMRRLHGAFVSEKEIAEVVDFVKKCQGEPDYIEEITQAIEEKTGADGIEHLDDAKYDEAVRVILSTGQASASYLQRRLKLGYSRAARLVEMMEANGILGPSQGSKPREILIREDDYPPAQEA